MSIKKTLLIYTLILSCSSAAVTSVLIVWTEGSLWVLPLIMAAIFLISICGAPFAVRFILKPVNDIDLEHPESGADDDAIFPLLQKLRERNEQINNRVRELDLGRREFSAIMGNMSEGLLVLDHGGKVLSHNKSAAQMLAADPEEMSGLNILALNREEKFRETVKLALEGSPCEKVIELRGRQYQIFINPVLESDVVQGVILLLLDVTEKQERDNLRHEFTTNVSHELKTPLTVISGYAELMAGGMVKNKDIPEFANNIYREAQRLIVLFNDLMFLSGLEENKQPEKGPVDLLSLSREVSRRLINKAGDADVSIKVTGEPAEIDGLITVLDEMIFNLIENAIKYNRPGGNVTVDVSKRGGAAALTVSDTGIGIPETERERIFERFYRVDKSHNNAIPGTGLGLSIVKHGAILHNAEVELESGDKGSSFTLLFPTL